MKCQDESGIVLSAGSSYINGLCAHKFCQSCFRKENRFPLINNCPCCHKSFYDIERIEEAVLFGEAATLSNHIAPYLLSETDIVLQEKDITCIDEMNISVIMKLDAALQLNAFNFCTLFFISRLWEWSKVS